MVPLHGLRPRKILPETKVRWEVEGRVNSAESDVSVSEEQYTYAQNLEVPRWSVIKEGSGDKSKFKLPKPYIQFQEAYNIPEYELDDEDEQFLAQYSKNGTVKKTKIHHQYISEDILETVIDYLEKESFNNKEYQLLIPSMQDKDQAFCCVCLRADRVFPDGTHSDSSIVDCQGCGITTHACCQGMKKIVNNWLCKRCVSEKRKTQNKKGKVSDFQKSCKKLAQDTQCNICHKPDGSMLQQNNSWVHNICIMWLPGHTRDESNAKQLCKNRCVVCRDKDNLIRCSENSCNIHYHGHCAQLSRFFFDSNFPDGRPVSYCYTHSLKMEKQVLEQLLPEGRASVAVGRFLTQSTRSEINKKLVGKEISEDVFNLIWEYWKKKRFALDYGRTPLISRLIIEKERLQTLNLRIEETRLSQAQLRWEYIKVQMDAFPLQDDHIYLNLLSMRNHLERLRVIADLVKKREKTKLLQTSLLIRQFGEEGIQSDSISSPAKITNSPSHYGLRARKGEDDEKILNPSKIRFPAPPTYPLKRSSRPTAARKLYVEEEDDLEEEEEAEVEDDEDEEVVVGEDELEDVDIEDEMDDIEEDERTIRKSNNRVKPVVRKTTTRRKPRVTKKKGRK